MEKILDRFNSATFDIQKINYQVLKLCLILMINAVITKILLQYLLIVTIFSPSLWPCNWKVFFNLSSNWKHQLH